MLKNDFNYSQFNSIQQLQQNGKILNLFLFKLNLTMKIGSSPKKADGETVPLLRDTITLMPVSIKGTEKSMTSDLSSLMVNEPTAMCAFFVTT